MENHTFWVTDITSIIPMTKRHDGLRKFTDNIEIMVQQNQPGCSGSSAIPVTNSVKGEHQRNKRSHTTEQKEVEHDQRLSRKQLPAENTDKAEEPIEGNTFSI